MFKTRRITAGTYGWLSDYLFSFIMKKKCYNYSNIVLVE